MVVGCSVGVAFWVHDAGTGADAVRDADTALYAAKRAGKNRFAMHACAVTPTARGRATPPCLEARTAAGRTPALPVMPDMV